MTITDVKGKAPLNGFDRIRLRGAFLSTAENEALTEYTAKAAGC